MQVQSEVDQNDDSRVQVSDHSASMTSSLSIEMSRLKPARSLQADALLEVAGEPDIWKFHILRLPDTSHILLMTTPVTVGPRLGLEYKSKLRVLLKLQATGGSQFESDLAASEFAVQCLRRVLLLPDCFDEVASASARFG